MPGIVTKILDKKIEKKKQILPNERIVRPSQLEKTLEEVNDLDKVLAWKGHIPAQDLKNREIYSILKNYDSSRLRHEEKYNFPNKFKDMRPPAKRWTVTNEDNGKVSVTQLIKEWIDDMPHPLPDGVWLQFLNKAHPDDKYYKMRSNENPKAKSFVRSLTQKRVTFTNSGRSSMTSTGAQPIWSHWNREKLWKYNHLLGKLNVPIYSS